MLVPKLFTTLTSYTRSQFTDDLVAGIIVGIVALPLAIAFAIASGVSPDRGLYRMRSHYSSSRCSRASGRP